MTQQIRFDDGAAYERYMGRWSQLVGRAFLEWLAPPSGLQWLDVGCGNGAFTEILVEQCAPAALAGIDPSEAQLAFARSRQALATAEFRQGDAMALPYENGRFDAAVMPLVIFFVPDPAQGVAEMTRVVRPGGQVTAYGWDLEGGGFPYAALQAELRALGATVPMPPSPDAASPGALRQVWTNAGLQAVEEREIVVRRTFESFDDYWSTVLVGPSVGASLAALSATTLARLVDTMRTRLPADAAGRITVDARANAIQGRVPGAHQEQT